jgi:DNA-binding response OmpR family regulator
MAAQILVIDAQATSRAILARSVGGWGYGAWSAASVGAALELSDVLPVDLVLLNASAGPDDYQRLRGPARDTPRPLIFAVDSAPEGADEYLPAPLEARSLRPRLQARLRPHPPSEGPSGRRAALGPITLHPGLRQVTVCGVQVPLTPLELRLLGHLVDWQGHLCTRQGLLATVWGHRAPITTRTVDAYVKRLRLKLGPGGHLIETVRGFGYRLIDRAGGVP